MQAGRLEVTVVASLEGFARELRTKVEAAAEGVAAKIAVKIDDKSVKKLRSQVKKAAEKASKGVTAKVRVKVDEDTRQLRRDVSTVTDEVAQGAAVNLPVRLGDDDGNGRTRSSGSGGGGLGRLVGRLRGSLRGLLSRVARDPEASTARVNVAPSRDSERRFGRSLTSVIRVAMRQLRVVTRDALAPTRGGLTTFVREMGRIAVTAGRDTGRAFSRAFWTMLGGKAAPTRALVARVRLGVAKTSDAVRSFASEARHFLATYSRDLVARVRIGGLRLASTDFRAIGREMRRLGEEAADALRMAFGGRLGGPGWIESLILGPMRDLAVRVRVGTDMSRRSAVAFARSVRDMAVRYRDQFTVGVRLAADSSRNAITSFGRSIRNTISPHARDLMARVRVATEPARTAAVGLVRDLRRVTATAARDTRTAVRVAVQPAARAVADLTRGVATVVGRASRAATTVIRARMRTDDDNGNFLSRGIRRVLAAGQAVADAMPINVPVMPSLGGRGGRRRFRMVLFGALLSVVQPAVAALVQYGAGLTALVSAAAPAVGVLGAIPGLIVAAGSAALGTKLAFSGFGQALKETLKSQQMLATDGKVTEEQQKKTAQAMEALAPSAKKAVAAVGSLSSAWDEVKASVSERFFSKVTADIKPLANTVLPMLKSALGDSAAQMGDLAHRGAEFMRSGIFRRDFSTIAGTNRVVVGHLTDSLANLGRASLDFLVASGPFVERVGAGTERMTQWMRASAQAGRETGSLARFLDHAGDKAAQLGRSMRSMFKGFGGVGKAGMDVGNHLLDGFEGTMIRFNRWANSKPGRKVMEDWFNDAAPTFHELNRLVGDFVRGLGRASTDSGIRDLIRQIRTELMPALGAFFDGIGHNIGPALISLISNLATAIGNLAAAGSGLGVLLVAFSGLLNAFNWLTDKVPFVNTVLATLLGTLLALKVISGITSIVQRFGVAIGAAGGHMLGMGAQLRGQLGPGVLGPQATGWQRIGAAYSGAAAQGGRLRGTLRGLTAANGAAVRVLGGMTAALGGPLGLAITGVTIGLGLLASSQEKAARAAQAHKDRVKSLADALADSNGVIDANVRAQAAMLLQDTELADGKGMLVDVMADAGIKLGKLTDAYLGQGTSLKDLEQQLQATADAGRGTAIIGGQLVQTMTDQGMAAMRAKDALGTVSGELEEGQKRHKELAEAIKETGDTGSGSYRQLQGAVQAFNDKAKTSDERVQALRTALDALKGNTMSVHEATARLNQTMLTIDDTMGGNIDKTEGWGKSLVGADKLVDTSTKNGQMLNQQLQELRDGMLQVSTSAREAADNDLMSMTEAMNVSRDAASDAREKAIALAEALNIPKDQAEALANQMGLVPDELAMVVTTDGLREGTAAVVEMRTKLNELAPGVSVLVKAPTRGAITELQALGYSVQRIPNSKNVFVTAPTSGPRANLQALMTDIANTPDKKNVTVQAIIQKATGELKGIQQQVAGMKDKKSITVTAPTAVAQKALEDLGYKIKTVDGTDGKKVRITAPTETPLGNVQTIQRAINGLTGKTIHVTVQYNESGKPSVVRTHADGGIVHYAEGGIRAAASRIRAFAAGAERHIAQIGKPGEIRIWNEPETQGEAYLPLAKAKRKRSKAILDEVARIFGGMVVYPGQGVQAFANGAVNLARSTSNARAATTPRTAVGRAAGALVGGDLNLTMTSAPMSPSQALGDAMFELRRIRLGGAYASE